MSERNPNAFYEGINREAAKDEQKKDKQHRIEVIETMLDKLERGKGGKDVELAKEHLRKQLESLKSEE